jgi:hypothetical protein
MTGKLLPFPARRPTPLRIPPEPPVIVEWDPIEGVYNAICLRCTEGLSTTRLDEAHDWAETHRCDPELAALLDAISGSAAA